MGGRTDLTEELWTKALKRVHTSSSCARLGLMQFKVLHRAHLSKARLPEIQDILGQTLAVTGVPSIQPI